MWRGSLGALAGWHGLFARIIVSRRVPVLTLLAGLIALLFRWRFLLPRLVWGAIFVLAFAFLLFAVPLQESAQCFIIFGPFIAGACFGSAIR